MKLAIYAGSAIWIGSHLLAIFTQPDPMPMLVAAAAGTLGMLLGALRLSQRADRQALRLSLGVLVAGMALFILGTLFTAVGILNAAGIATLGQLVVTFGLLAAGIANIRERFFGAFFWLPLAMTPVYMISWSVDPSSPNLFSNWTEGMAVLYGFDWLAMGITIKP